MPWCGSHGAEVSANSSCRESQATVMGNKVSVEAAVVAQRVTAGVSEKLP